MPGATTVGGLMKGPSVHPLSCDRVCSRTELPPSLRPDEVGGLQLSSETPHHLHSATSSFLGFLQLHRDPPCPALAARSTHQNLEKRRASAISLRGFAKRIVTPTSMVQSSEASPSTVERFRPEPTPMLLSRPELAPRCPGSRCSSHRPWPSYAFWLPPWP